MHTYKHMYKQSMLTLYSITYIHTCIHTYSTYIQYIYLVENHWVDLTSSTADLYSVLGSRKISGSGLRMLASRSPFASTGPLGITTYAYIHTYIQTYIHTYIHTDIHTRQTYMFTCIYRWYVITYSLIHNIHMHSNTILKHITVHTYIHTYIQYIHAYAHP